MPLQLKNLEKDKVTKITGKVNGSKKKENGSFNVQTVKTNLSIVHPCDDLNLSEAFVSQVFVNRLKQMIYRAGIEDWRELSRNVEKQV